MSNTDNYWFKRKRYGYGWTPSTWQGWISTIVFTVILLIFGLLIENNESKNFNIDIAIYFMLIILNSIFFMKIVKKHGPKPKWRWGATLEDNPNEDI